MMAMLLRMEKRFEQLEKQGIIPTIEKQSDTDETQTPESTYTNYILTFDDDHDEAGYPPPRPVPFVHVVPLPKNFIPTGSF